MPLDIDTYCKHLKRETEIHCPFCDAIYEDDEYKYVSYHGEDSQAEQECYSCGKTFWLEEIVRRTYKTAKTEKELNA